MADFFNPGGISAASGGNIGDQLYAYRNSFSWLRPDRPDVGGAIGLAGEEARNVTNEENRRFFEQSDFLGQEFDNANKPTFSQGDIERFFGSALDRIGGDTAQLQSNVRESLGQSGVRGGEAAGLSAAVELQRLGQITGARRDLEVFKANADRQDAIDRWGRSLGLASYRSQSPSTFFSDFASSNVNTQLALYGIDKQDEAAKRAADASESAGALGLFGDIIGFAGGLF